MQAADSHMAAHHCALLSAAASTGRNAGSAIALLIADIRDRSCALTGSGRQGTTLQGWQFFGRMFSPLGCKLGL
jgi:hypothetical protein